MHLRIGWLWPFSTTKKLTSPRYSLQKLNCQNVYKDKSQIFIRQPGTYYLLS